MGTKYSNKNYFNLYMVHLKVLAVKETFSNILLLSMLVENYRTGKEHSHINILKGNVHFNNAPNLHSLSNQKYSWEHSWIKMGSPAIFSLS